MPPSVLEQSRSRWAVDCRETHLRRLVAYLGHNQVSDALLVLHPERKRPLRALRITASNASALPYSDIDGWLSQRAPQIHRNRIATSPGVFPIARPGLEPGTPRFPRPAVFR
jgi:hypothetical protein